MAYLDHNNPFQGWILSTEETLQGQVFTLLQKQVLQNERTRLANRRIAIKFDPEHPLKFQQEDAELQGQIGILSYLLEMSDAAEKILSDGTSAKLVINSQE